MQHSTGVDLVCSLKPEVYIAAGNVHIAGNVKLLEVPGGSGGGRRKGVGNTLETTIFTLATSSINIRVWPGKIKIGAFEGKRGWWWLLL